MHIGTTHIPPLQMVEDPPEGRVQRGRGARKVALTRGSVTASAVSATAPHFPIPAPNPATTPSPPTSAPACEARNGSPRSLLPAAHEEDVGVAPLRLEAGG